MLGELFPGRKLLDEGGEDSDGKLHRPRFDIDLDNGVVRLPNLGGPKEPPADEKPPANERPPADETDQAPDER